MIIIRNSKLYRIWTITKIRNAWHVYVILPQKHRSCVVVRTWLWRRSYIATVMFCLKTAGGCSVLGAGETCAVLQYPRNGCVLTYRRAACMCAEMRWAHGRRVFGLMVVGDPGWTRSQGRDGRSGSERVINRIAGNAWSAASDRG